MEEPREEIHLTEERVTEITVTLGQMLTPAARLGAVTVVPLRGAGGVRVACNIHDVHAVRAVVQHLLTLGMPATMSAFDIVPRVPGERGTRAWFDIMLRRPFRWQERTQRC